MKRLLAFLLAAAFAATACGQPTPANHQRGAKVDHAKWAAAPKIDHRIRMAFSQPPESLGFVPQHLSYWGNNQYGDCVTAEAAAAAYTYRVMLNAAGYSIPEFTITDDAVVSWARAHGDLNGAMLEDVMSDMAKDGLPDTNKILHLTGKYSAVDYTSQDAIKVAFSSFGPLKIAIASSQLDGPVQGKNGWILTGARSDRNSDHCVCIVGYGRMDALAKMLGVTLPSKIDGSKFGVLMFTWSTIGIVDWSSLQAIMAAGVCYARDPVDLPGGKPYPTPGPSPIPVTNWPPLTGEIFYRGGAIDGTITLTLPANQPAGAWKYLVQKNKSGKFSLAPQVFGEEAFVPYEPPVMVGEPVPAAVAPKAVTGSPSSHRPVWGWRR